MGRASAMIGVSNIVSSDTVLVVQAFMQGQAPKTFVLGSRIPSTLDRKSKEVGYRHTNDHFRFHTECEECISIYPYKLRSHLTAYSAAEQLT
jgi:hypothetical protein